MTDAERELLISLGEYVAAHPITTPEGDSVRDKLRLLKSEFRSTSSEGVRNYRVDIAKPGV